MTTIVKHGKRVKKPIRAPKEMTPKKDPRAEKKALIDSLCGSLAWVDYSVDEYLREKREEVKRENRR